MFCECTMISKPLALKRWNILIVIHMLHGYGANDRIMYQIKLNNFGAGMLK